jgi:hypothetical protein
VLLIGVWQFAKTRYVVCLIDLIVSAFVPEALLQYVSTTYAVAFFPLLGTAYGVFASLRHPGAGEEATTLRGAWILSACLIPILFFGVALT